MIIFNIKVFVAHSDRALRNPPCCNDVTYLKSDATKPQERTILSLVFVLPLLECTLYHLPLGGLLAGTRILYAGQFHGTL